MKITKRVAKKIFKTLSLNSKVVSIDDFFYGLNVELEHGSKISELTNITGDDLNMTAMITVAHLSEFPDYYKRLKKMEEQAETYWKKRTKPNIFI